MSDDEDILYHVTCANNLESISNVGLVPGATSAMGGGGNAGHSIGKVFLTDAAGVSFWFGRSQDWAEHMSDSPQDDGLVPVVLRVTVPDWDAVEEDEPGSRDSRHDAWAYKGSINPDAVEVWNGEMWLGGKEYFEDDDGNDVYFEEVDTDLSYDDQGYPLQDSENPLFPEL